MPDPAEIAEIDAYKEPIYRLCDFLISKKSSEEGRGLRRPTIFPLGELSDIIADLGGDTPADKIEKMKAELCGLSVDSVTTENGEQKIIEILNPEILESFSENFRNNAEIKIKCSSEILGKYKTELVMRTEALKRRLGGIRIVATESGGVLISSGEKTMEIRPRKSSFPIGPYLVLLLAGESIPLSSGPMSIRSFRNDQGIAGHNDYERGHSVGIDFLQKVFSFIKNGRNWQGFVIFPRRSITDSLRLINKKSEKPENFGVKIFQVEDSVRWTF